MLTSADSQRTTDARPDPDELLHRVQAEERKRKRGRLTVFFGAVPEIEERREGDAA